MKRDCLKCGWVNNAARGGSLEACPQCAAIYSKVEAARMFRPASGGQATKPSAAAAKAEERAAFEREWALEEERRTIAAEATHAAMRATQANRHVGPVRSKILPWLIAAVVVVGLVDFLERPATTRNQATSAVAAARPIYHATPKELLDGYRANEVRQDEAMAGMDVQVVGVVESIRKGAFGGMHVSMETGALLGSLGAAMEDDQTSAVARLNKGDSVTVVCESFAFILGSPMGSKCRMQ